MDHTVPGMIEPGRLYVAEEARTRLRIGKLGWKKLRDGGLPVVRHGRTAYVFGDDLLDVLRKKRKPAHE